MAVELVARRGMVGTGKRRVGGGESRASYTFSPRDFPYSWCVAPLHRNDTTSTSKLVMTYTMIFLTHLARSSSASTKISPQWEPDD